MKPIEIASLLSTTVAQLVACRAVVDSEVSAALADLPPCGDCPRLDHVRVMTPSEMGRVLEMTIAQLDAFRSLVAEAAAGCELSSIQCAGCAVKALGKKINDHLSEVQAAKRIDRGQDY